MDRLIYQAYEAGRQTDLIKDVVRNACKIVFADRNLAFCVKDGGWFTRGPSEQVTVTVFKKTGCCQRQPVCTIEIERPKTAEGMFNYAKASGTFLDRAEHAGNTRLIGHLQRHCPFLPKFDVTMAYELQ
jgi:hypothetical protein